MKFVKKQGEYMKFTKLSLVAALLAGSAAFAIDNVKVSGDANVFYHTSDAQSTYDAVAGKTKGKLFSKDSSAADASVNLNVTADLLKNDLVTLSAGAGYTVLTTLGLENNFVSNVWGSSHSATTGAGQQYATALGGAKVENSSWVTEAWVAATVGKTTAKLGRMELDTPLAFTETWSIEKNTFEAAVLINQDIPDTTLVGAWVGNGNGTPDGAVQLNPIAVRAGLAVGGVVNTDGKFNTYGKDGAYAVGVINNSFKPLTVQAWYYNVLNVAPAYWLQADLACEKIPGLLAGAQYSAIELEGANTKEDNVYALMLGFDMKDIATFKVAYSDVNKNGSIGAAGFNTATASGASKLYTESWWTYGKVTQTDTQSYAISVESPVNGLFDLGVYYTDADQSTTAGDNDLTELTVTVGKSFGPADLTLAYINTDAKTPLVYGDDETSNTIQAYITVNF